MPSAPPPPASAHLSDQRAADRRLFLAVLLFTGWRIATLFVAPLNLSFDEAQYWGWAQDLAFGYFSKPPLVAWVIALTTAIGGSDAEAWVRLGSPIAHGLAALALGSVGARLYGPRAGLWSGLVWLTLPGVSLSAMIISTDPFLLLFWALALQAFVRAREPGASTGWWALLGLWLGLGLLAKYAMAFFVLGLAVHLAWSAEDRPWLRRPGPWLALALGGLLYAPNVWWNAVHGFASYRHTGENANLKGHLFNPGELGEFIGSQFGVFGPALFAALLVLLLVRFRAVAGDGRARLLIALTVPTLAAIAVQSFLSRANANWAATAFVAATPLVVGWLVQRGAWFRVVTVSVILHSLAAAALYNLDGLFQLTGTRVPARLDLAKRVRGWDQAGEWVRAQALANPGLTLLFDDRKTMASLLYYARPLAFDARMWNPDGQVLNHYELTASLGAADQGRNFLLITREADPAAAQAPAFATVEAAGVLRLTIHPTYVLALRAYRLEGFTGYGGKAP